MPIKSIMLSAMTGVLALSVAEMSLAATNATTAASEKCYGIVKAGMNDCATKTQSCAGSSVKDNQPDAFIFLPKGLCAKIVGGKPKP